jgi:predicted nuclease of restriction endonuclease-like RecB superfamily
VVSDEERQKVISDIAAKYGLSPDDVERDLWADLEENEVLASRDEASPEELIREYNLSSTQTLLFDAARLKFRISGNFQNVFCAIKMLGLMYSVDKGLEVTVDGPASIFKSTRKYGVALAKIIPHIISADEWEINAEILEKGAGGGVTRLFSMRSTAAHMFPKRAERGMEGTFDSKMEKKFYNAFSSAEKRGWRIKREPTILRAGPYVLIPDFGFELGEKGFYVEIVGFWTPEYIRRKIEKARRLESDRPVIFAVNKHLNCTKEDFGEKIDEVFFYSNKIPTEQVMKRMREIESASS